MRKIKIGELKKHIELFDDAHVPLMIYGTFGIGKSDIVKRSAEEKSQKHADRTYLDWMATADDVKLDALKNPGKYFAFIDIRLSQMEPAIFAAYLIFSIHRRFPTCRQYHGRGLCI